MRRLTLTVIALATSLSALGATPAAAQRGYDRYDRYSQVDYERDGRGYDRYDRYDRRDYDRRDYNRRGDRGNSRYYYRGRGCDNGTGGTVIGAIAGGLAGHELAGRRGDRTAGVLIGGVLGALAGRAIDRSDDRCR